MSTVLSEKPDVVLIGAGIMSATLGTVLKELEPTDIAERNEGDDPALQHDVSLRPEDVLPAA